MFPTADATQQARRGVSAFAPTGFNAQKPQMSQTQTGLSSKQPMAGRSAFAPVTSSTMNRGAVRPVNATSIFHQPNHQRLQQQQPRHNILKTQLPSTLPQQQVLKQPIPQYRDTTEEVNGDDDDLVQLPLPTVGFSLEDDTEEIKDSFYLDLQTVTGAGENTINTNDSDHYEHDPETLEDLAIEFEEMTMKLNEHPTDFNDLTALSTYVDQISIASIPVNCFSIATPMSNGSYCTATPQQTLAVRKDIKQLRSTISTIRHQMLSSLHANPTQILLSTNQLVQYVQTYGRRGLKYNQQTFEPQHERRWTAVDYMWRIANQNKMFFETFCHGVHILDRVLSMPQQIPCVQSNDLQLTSLVCLFLAYKMIEKRIAAAASIHGSVGTNKFSRDDIQRREQLILNALNFEIAPTSIYDMVYQLALIFASTRQRDNPLHERTQTDDLSTKSGRFIRLRYMLQFLTYCTITSSHYLKHDPFALSCAITMTALGAIVSDFSQVWPVSMAMLTGVLPDDVMGEIEFVVQCHRSVKTVMNSRNGFVSASALESFGIDMAYHVSSWKIDYNEIVQRVSSSHTIAQKWLSANNINLSMLQRICGIQHTVLRAASILDQRTLRRKPQSPAKVHFQSPPRNNNSNIIRPTNQMSPILKKEQELQKSQGSASSATEYLVVLMVDMTQKSAFSVTTDGKASQSIQDGLIGSNHVCLKIWMNEETLGEIQNGYEVVDDYRSAIRKAEYEARQATLPPRLPAIPADYQPVYQSPFAHSDQQTPTRTRKAATPIEDLQSQFQSPKQAMPRRIVPSQHQIQQQQQQHQIQQQQHQIQQTKMTQSTTSHTDSSNKRIKRAKENQSEQNSNCSIM